MSQKICLYKQCLGSYNLRVMSSRFNVISTVYTVKQNNVPPEPWYNTRQDKKERKNYTRATKQPEKATFNAVNINYIRYFKKANIPNNPGKIQ